MNATPSPDPEVLTIRASRRGVLAPTAGVVVALAVGLGLFVVDGVSAGAIVVSVLAVGALAVVLFDMPLATEFDTDGFVRVTPLRRARRSWDDIDRLERGRSGWYRRRAAAGVGLVAIRGGFRYLLVDRTERPSEHERLLAILRAADADWVATNLAPPPNMPRPR
ncbi:MAG: hypothetical protein ACE37B_18495 [Ilumatobacter sp.]|uniref:hypothetical protein n=1 Tax=Ilumatobacter sp. TaxID=1967498 RepID=UPI00391CF97C